jgi:hypothetical protein
MRLLSIIPTLCVLATASASVTIYSQVPYYYATAVTSASNPGGTISSTPPNGVDRAYDTSTLNPPALPNPLPATQWNIGVPSNQASMSGLSLIVPGDFLGFSIEMSVVTQVIGLNSSFVSVPFLNLMSNLAARGGGVRVRIGGNTQDYAVYVSSISDGSIIEKLDASAINNPTETPPVLYTVDMFYLMGNVSHLAKVQWYLGIPFNDTTNLRLQIAEYGDRILGDNILGYQVGNEPDLYPVHGHRPTSYSPYDYFGEFGVLVNAVGGDTNIPTKNNLIAPNLSGAWTPEEVWNTGFISSYASSLGILSVEHYPTDNCLAIYGGNGTPVDYQTEFATYLEHTAGQNIVSLYLNSSNIAQAAGKPFMMFETNTASCGGFPGISNSFGAALWGLDYALQMAYSNFSGALFHVGGRDVFYNPFTPPPTNETLFRSWTIGPLYYTTLVSAEIFGTTGTARIIDLNANNGNIYTPAYAIYENNAVSKFAIFNYLDDPTGANNNIVTISLTDTTVPSTVGVKYLLSPSVATIGNISWAGQTFGGVYESDGRLQGEEHIQQVSCNQAANTCQISVPAPGFALVFLNSNSNVETVSAMTFSTTAYTNTENTATVGPSVLATSNGHSGKDRADLGSTSSGSRPNGATSVSLGPDVIIALASFGLGLAAIFMGRWW